jgi:LmbE family N-acetylglucosaminyl deacetylase
MIRFHNADAELFVPDDVEDDAALARTTHMAIGAHPDDIAIMAYHGIDECFGRTDQWFLAVTATDGAGSPRSDAYAAYSDDEMRRVRAEEEKKAAVVGEYGAAALLAYTSEEAKTASPTLVEELTSLISSARPRVMYTHNLADRHDTHVAVALRTIEALHLLPPDARPEALYGCEVWRDLDWLVEDDKVVFDVSDRLNLAASLIGVYDSQISGGKRYDVAAAGRWAANATYSRSHEVDTASALIFAMDLTPLLDEEADPSDHVERHIDSLRSDVTGRLERLRAGGTE